jgi:hypothetical protein
MAELINNKILIIKGILSEKCGLNPKLYDELSELLDDIKILSDAKGSALENAYTELKQLTLPVVNKSLPDWYKEINLLELQMQALKEDIPRNLIERRGYLIDLETFDMKLTAMQNRLHRAFEELKGNVL